MTNTARLPARNKSIDLLKFVAAIFVVCIHTKTTSSVDNFERGSFSFIVDCVARFAVPFFFISSGYLIDFTNRKKVVKKLINIAIVYVCWAIIFILIRKAYNFEYPAFMFTTDKKVSTLLNTIYIWLFYGQERHLWFFPAYILGALMMLAFNRNYKTLAIIATLLYLIGLTGQSLRFIYPEYIPSIPMASYPYEWLQKPYLTRNGIFLAFPCMAAGYIIRRYKNSLTTNRNTVLIIAAITLFIIQYIECSLMHSKTGTVADFYFSTLPLSCLLLILTIKHADYDFKLKNTGKLSGGIYVLHPIFMYMVFAYGASLTKLAAWPYIYTPLLIAASWLGTLLISKIPWVRKLIMY